MKISEIRAKTEGELQKDLSALRERIREMRFKMGSQEVKNTSEMGKIRKDIAKILTALKEKK